MNSLLAHIKLLRPLNVFIAGLAMANIDSHSYHELVDYHVFGDDIEIFGRAVTAHFLINEIFMVFFFGIAAKEIPSRSRQFTKVSGKMSYVVSNHDTRNIKDSYTRHPCLDIAMEGHCGTNDRVIVEGV